MDSCDISCEDAEAGTLVMDVPGCSGRKPDRKLSPFYLKLYVLLPYYFYHMASQSKKLGHIL